MTIETATNKSGPYDLDGVTLTFDRTFKLEDAAHLQVWRYFDGGRELIETGYTQTGIGDVAGTVTFASGAGISSGQLMLVRAVPSLQQTDYSNQSRVYPETIERDLDLITMQIQDVKEEIGRAFRIPLNTTATPEELEELTADAIRLYESISEIDRLSASADNIDALALIAGDLDELHGNLSEIVGVHAQLAKLIVLHSELSKLLAIYASIASGELGDVHAALPEIGAVEDKLTELLAVHSDLDEILALHAAIPTIEANKVAAQNAATSASTSATNAQKWAESDTAPGEAGTKSAKKHAEDAAGSAGAAAGSATAAGNAATSASTAATNAQKWAESDTAPGGAGTKSAKKHAEDAAASAASIDADKLVPIGLTSFWTGGRANIPDGWDALDGQVVNRADFPDLWAAVNAGVFPTVTDAVWLATPGKRGCFTPGNGTTTFRFPDANGKQSGSLPGLYFRGDGKVGTAVGDVLDMMIQSHTHEIPYVQSNNTTTQNVGSGASTNPTSRQTLPTGGDETRPVSFVAVVIMRTRGVFNAVIAPGTGATLGANVFSGSQSVGGDMTVAGTLTGKAPDASPVKALFGDGVWKPTGWAGTQWVDVTASRLANTSYQNTTGRDMLVAVAAQSSARELQVSPNNIDWVDVGRMIASHANQAQYALVAAGEYYRINGTVTSFTQWTERRA